MMLTESNLRFSFPDNVNVIKFVDTNYFKNKFQNLPRAKGVDFVADSEKVIWFIEVKNCKGYESDNRYRIAPNNAKVHTAPTTVDVSDRESLDYEVAQKVAMTIACLVGALTKPEHQGGDELKPYCKSLTHGVVDAKQLKILLFLEGDFGTRTHSKKMIMKALASSIKNKLFPWLNCQVFVGDVANQHNRSMSVEFI